MPRSAVIGIFVGMLSVGCSHSAIPGLLVRDTERGALGFVHHEPAGAPVERVILAHGFLRTPATMNHLGEALAVQGIETATIRLRRSKPWDGDHAENARDMIALRKALGWEKASYAGFSAGGLSALLAAAEDEGCVKLLILDPVDHNSLGAQAAPEVRVPAFAILARPGPGNANRNATEMLAALPQAETIEIADATHCDFEARPSALCHFLTGANPDPHHTAEVHTLVIRHSTAFLSNHTFRP